MFKLPKLDSKHVSFTQEENYVSSFEMFSFLNTWFC